MYLGEKVDLLITYVNCRDAKWQADYEIAAHTKVNDAMMERFRSFGTLRYLLRGIGKFMPYVDRVILIVSSKSQVPKWVNQDNVRVVTHSDYIPEYLLPTFNSCVIESFFYKIPDLSNYIIYTNDDIYPLLPTNVEDFFTDGLPNNNFKFYGGFSKDNMFRRQCKNGADLIYSVLKEKGMLSKTENPTFFKPDHAMTSMKKDSLEAVGKLLSTEIAKRATQFRSNKNVNQHLYLYYQYFTNTFFEKALDYKYVTFVNSWREILNDISNPQHKILCLNDSGLYSYQYDEAKTKVQNALVRHLPEKCKFEK